VALDTCSSEVWKSVGRMEVSVGSLVLGDILPWYWEGRLYGSNTRLPCEARKRQGEKSTGWG
jgi:hypothetical protein